MPPIIWRVNFTRMGNSNAKQLKITNNFRRSQFLAVAMKKKVNRSTSMSLPDHSSGFPFMTSKPVTRRMAIFGQDYEKSKVKVEKEVDLDFVYRVVKSQVIVDPNDFKPSEGYRTCEKHIHGTDSEKVFREIARDIFKPTRTRKRYSQKFKDKV